METTSPERIKQLLQRRLDGQLTPLETEELWEYVLVAENRQYIESLLGEGFALTITRDDLEVHQQDEMISSILGHEDIIIPAGRQRRLWPRIGIAAAVATIIVSAGIWFYKSDQNNDNNQVAYSDVAPGGQGATLTLADGKRIRLNDAANGQLAKEAGVSISKSKDGKLVYEITGTSVDPNKINILSTAKGETYEVRLPDGSLVALNAASSLSYPANFTALKERRVKLTGEGYFEIAKDKNHPFIVATDEQQVEVLGTHFNINSYQDEADTKTTLLEGSVKVSAQGNTKVKVLKPGEQALLSGSEINISTVDVDEAIAWKNGKFVFEEENIEVIMRTLARWYNVEVVYEGNIQDKNFTASISRSDNISKILSKLSYSNKVHFKIEGRRIKVMQ